MRYEEFTIEGRNAVIEAYRCLLYTSDAADEL